MPKSTQDKETAWAWIEAFAGEKNAKRNLVEHGINSVWLSTYQDPDSAKKYQHYWPVMQEGFPARRTRRSRARRRTS